MIQIFFFITLSFAITCRDMPKINKKSDYLFVHQGSSFMVYFNLCGPVNTKFENFDTKKTSVVADISQSKKTYKRLGNTTTEKITKDENPETGEITVYFDYEGDWNHNEFLKSRIIVKCGEHDTSSKIQGRLNDDGAYEFSFTSPDVCGVDDFPLTGIILCGILIIIVLLYIIIGVLVNTFIKQKRGLEIIPNFEMWKELPSLIKDGFLFTFTCKSKEAEYEPFLDEVK